MRGTKTTWNYLLLIVNNKAKWDNWILVVLQVLQLISDVLQGTSSSSNVTKMHEQQNFFPPLYIEILEIATRWDFAPDRNKLKDSDIFGCYGKDMERSSQVWCKGNIVDCVGDCHQRLCFSIFPLKMIMKKKQLLETDKLMENPSRCFYQKHDA